MVSALLHGNATLKKKSNAPNGRRKIPVKRFLPENSSAVHFSSCSEERVGLFVVLGRFELLTRLVSYDCFHR